MRESNISTYGMSYKREKYAYIYLKVYFVKKKLTYEFLIFTIFLGDISRNVLY